MIQTTEGMPMPHPNLGIYRLCRIVHKESTAASPHHTAQVSISCTSIIVTRVLRALTLRPLHSMHPDLTLRCGLMEAGRRPLARLFEAVTGRCAILGRWQCWPVGMCAPCSTFYNVLLAKGQKGSRHKRTYSLKRLQPFCQSIPRDYQG